MNNLQDDGWDLSDLKYVQLTPKQFETWRLVSGDIVFNRTNSKELVGKCEVFAEEGDWVFASYLIRLRVDSGVARPQFVSDFLATKTGRLQIDRESRQIIGMSNINAEEIRTLRIPLPKPQDQDRLVDHMNSARSERAGKFREADELLLSLDAYVLDQLGLALPNLPPRLTWAARWSAARTRLDADYHSPKFRILRQRLDNGRFPLISVGQFCPNPASGFAAGRGDQEEDPTIGVPHIRPLNITGTAELTFKSTKSVPVDSVGPNDAIQRGEVLFNNTNSTAWVGKTVVFDVDQVCACSNHITRLAVDRTKVLPEYIAAVFNALRSLGYFGLLSTNFNQRSDTGLRTGEIPAFELGQQRASLRP